MKSNSTVIDKDGSDTKKKPRKTPPPRKYKVIYHNDDYTPIEFVTWTKEALKDILLLTKSSSVS